METYRAEKQATLKIALADEDAEIDPIQAERGVGVQEPLLEFTISHPERFQQDLG